MAYAWIASPSLSLLVAIATHHMADQLAMKAQLVSIDEAPDQVWGRLWATTNVARRRDRSPRGQRVRAAAPQGRWRTAAFVGALCHDGTTALLVIDCAMDGTIFRTCVERVLAPTLGPGDIVDRASVSGIWGLKPDVRSYGWGGSLFNHTEGKYIYESRCRIRL